MLQTKGSSEMERPVKPPTFRGTDRATGPGFAPDEASSLYTTIRTRAPCNGKRMQEISMWLVLIPSGKGEGFKDGDMQSLSQTR